MSLDPAPLDTTQTLLQRIRAGEASARDQLLSRYLPLLRAWAHGRLPAGARGMADTDDLVQITLIRALNRLEAFEYRHEGGFLAYLRHSVLNAVRQEIRRARRKPVDGPVGDSQPDLLESVTARVIRRETMEHYEQALMELTEDQREAVMLRLEFGLSYPEVAEALGKPSANAARMLVVRGLVTLAELMAPHAPGEGA
jgi:RNA polymerase sigma-70 factor (ECF subfamily)